MSQIKEKNKTPEKELDEMEISNRSDAEFKRMVIGMLKKHMGNYTSIKKDPGRNKSYIK